MIKTRPSQTKNLYERLGISEDSILEDVKKAYRTLALQWHPDRNPDNPEAQEEFKFINEAYRVLKDPDKRRQYNHLRMRQTTQSEPCSGCSEVEDLIGDLIRSTYSDSDLDVILDFEDVYDEATKSLINRIYGKKVF